MAEPVIFDDGGSTRIKRVLPGNGVGEMDSLLNVDDLGGGVRGSLYKVNDTFSQVLIVCQDKTGKPFSSTHALNGPVEVISGLNQQVSAQMVSGDLLLTVSSSASDPIVEAKQHKRKRRYVVSNSGPIETVTINGAKVYDTGPNGTLPAGANRPVLYTSVVLT